MDSTQDILKRLIARLQNESNFPAISEYITELSSKAAPTSESSANELAALILRDYSLTSRLLKVSNSAMYGQFSGTIATVSRAVVVLGFEQVQLTAAGLIFFEQLQDKATAHYTKEAVLSAFLSGILARDLAKALQLEGWENFYIGAMFHNFGRLLTMYYFRDEFDSYKRLVATGAAEDEETERKALGVSFAELGTAIARSWSLPDQIVVSMKVPEEDELKKSGSKVNHQQILPRFANELCDLTMNVPQDRRLEQLDTLLEKYRKPYPVRQNEIVAMMDEAIKEMQRFTDVLRLDQNDLQRLDHCSFTPSEEVSIDPEKRAANTINRFEISSSQHPTGVLTREQRKQHLQDGIQEITTIMLDDFSLDEVLSMILETIFRGIGFTRLVIFFRNPQKDEMQARYALGPNTARLIGACSFPLDLGKKNLFDMALAENKDLYIANIADVEVRDFKPDWFDGQIFSPSFALYPIVINKRPIGLIYGGHDMPGEHLDQEQLSTIKTLRNQAAIAIKQCAAGG